MVSLAGSKAELSGKSEGFKMSCIVNRADGEENRSGEAWLMVVTVKDGLYLCWGVGGVAVASDPIDRPGGVPVIDDHSVDLIPGDVSCTADNWVLLLENTLAGPGMLVTCILPGLRRLR